MIIALDIGTSSARAALYDEQGRRRPGRFHQVPYRPAVTADGGVEHDPRRLVEAAAACLDALQGGQPAVEAVAVTSFWHGLLGLDDRGRPLTPVYMWGDTRSAPDAALLRDALDEAALHARTGCHLHPSYWPAKLRWLARERPIETRRVRRWGSIGEYLELELFGQAATSLSMASATGLLDQDRLAWVPEALAAAGVDSGQLFPLADQAEARRGLRPAWARRWPALRGAAWLPAVGDGAASNVGSDCTGPDRLALNVGTSIALRLVTPAALPPPRGLWRYRLDRRRSLLGGALSEGGNLYEWCRGVLRLPDGPEIEAALAAMAPAAHRLTVLPFIAGERAPGWRGARRATVAGLHLDTTALEILRAALEAVALRVALVYRLLAPLAGPDHLVVASGGAVARSRVWAQILADALGRPLAVSAEEEATCRGAALLGLEALGRPARDPAAPPAARVEPDPARHALYGDALGRQLRLDAAIESMI